MADYSEYSEAGEVEEAVWDKGDEMRKPRLCDGGCVFMTMLCGCCCLGLIIPCALLIPLALSAGYNLTIRDALLATMGAMVGCGCIFCWACGLCPIIIGGVCCKPPPTPLLPTFSQPFSGKRLRVRRLLVICNPFAGVKRAKDLIAEECMPIWKKAKISVDIEETQYHGHARDIAYGTNHDKYDIIAAMGGDGTVCEVYNGLMRAHNEGKISTVPALALIPVGTANDLGTDLKLFKEKERDQSARLAAEAIAQGCVQPWEHMHCVMGGRSQPVYGTAVAFYGPLNDVAEVADDYRCCGPSRYDNLALWYILKGMTPRVSFKLGSGKEITSNVKFIAITKTKTIAKDVNMLPHAQLDNGTLELVYANNTRAQMMKLFLQYPTASMEEGKYQHTLRDAEVTITSPESPFVFGLDGERFTARETVTLKCESSPFLLIVPESVFDGQEARADSSGTDASPDNSEYDV